MFKIYPKTNNAFEGLDKFKDVIKEFGGLEIQFFNEIGIANYVSFKEPLKKLKDVAPDVKEVTVHPPLCNYDLEILFLKDEDIIVRELTELRDLSEEYDLDINVIYHTKINYEELVACLDDRMKKVLSIIEGTRVTMLIENVYMVEEKSMSALEYVAHLDHPNLRCCFDLCHAYCKAHIYHEENLKYFDKYIDAEKAKKYVKQVHFSFTRNDDGYRDGMTHGRQHDTFDSLCYDLDIIRRYGMIDANIVTEVDEDDKNYFERKNELNDIRLLYQYQNMNFPRIEGDKMYKRILMKLSGEALSGDKGFGFDDENIKVVIKQIKELLETKVELALLVGGGNIWRGRNNPDMDLSKSHQMGIMATVINAMYVQEMLREEGIKARVITPFPISGIAEDFEKIKVNDYLKNGEVIIFAGGSGQPYFTTDTGAVLNALKIDAEALLLAKNVDGVYDKDPKKFDDAVKFNKITFKEVLDRELGVMDLTAVILCMENNLDIVVFDLNTEGNIMKNVHGEITGTLVTKE
ncbi:MAG: UMP kinase [Clostridia bacterium]|nr:UMP kinase [Clostridia bacterium]